MKRCPICQNTFDDSLRFCQLDGTLLVEDAGGGSSVDSMKTVIGGAPIQDRADDVAPLGEDATQTLTSPNDALFGAGQNNSSSPFDDFSSSSGSASSPFSNESSAGSPQFGSTGYRTPFDEPSPQNAPFNPNSFDASQSSFGQPLEQSNWTPPPAPNASWQSQNIGANTPFQPPMVGTQGDDKTLAIVSLVTGILSLTCCGAVTGIIALITGFMAKNNVDSNPQQYGGRGLAVAGMIMGGISIVLTALWLIFVVIGGALR